MPTAKQLSSTAQSFDTVTLGEKTKRIVNELHSKSLTDIAKLYKISDKQAVEVKKYFEDLYSNTYSCYKALDLFDGLMYRNICVDTSKPEIQDFIDSHIYITSSLYGIINATDLISKHRLDFMQPIKIDNLSLKNYWQDSYDNFIKDESLVISLLSSEFEEVFSKECRDKFIKLVFAEKKEGKLKIHSTISKKARGKFLSELINKQIKTITEIKTITFDGFTYCKDLSESNKLFFIKEL
nr:peroxide stress protein YaaA [Actinomyces sp. zg-332]